MLQWMREETVHSLNPMPEKGTCDYCYLQSFCSVRKTWIGRELEAIAPAVTA